MKAIYNVTGEIVDIEDMSIVTYKSSDGTYVKTLIKNFTFIDAEKDYYTKLEHQYAGMAMNALLLTNNIRNGDLEGMRECNTNAMAVAYALVEKLKKRYDVLCRNDTYSDSLYNLICVNICNGEKRIKEGASGGYIHIWYSTFNRTPFGNPRSQILL